VAPPRTSTLVLVASLLVAAPALAADENGGPTGLGHLHDDEAAIEITPASSESLLKLSPRGALQMRVGVPFQDPTGFSVARGDLTEARGFVMRRARLGLDATIIQQISAHLSADLWDGLMPAANKTPIFLAWANVDLRLFQIRGGFMRVPFTRHSIVDETRQVFLEAPTAWRSDRYGFAPTGTTSVLPDRRVGLEMHEDYGLLNFSVGAWSGGLLAPESAESFLFGGRVELTPWLAPPAEGAFFRGDYEQRDARFAFSLGGLGRVGPDGSSQAGSLGVAFSYRGLYAAVEGVLGRSQNDGGTVSSAQRALVLDLAYRFPGPFQGFELGLRGDLWSTGAGAATSELRGLWAVANLYVWRHRIKASTLFHATGALTATPVRARQEAIVELTVGF
jgi:hypothetical protein